MAYESIFKVTVKEQAAPSPGKSIFTPPLIVCTEVRTMGKRVRDWDLPSGSGKLLVLLCAVFLAGGAAGCLFAGLAEGEGARALSSYLADYLTLAREGTVVRDFWPTLWEQLRWLALTVLLGLTAIGAVGIPLLFCLRGFFFAFSVGCFCRVFGGAGLVPALVLFGLPALLWAPALFLAGFWGMSGSLYLLRRGVGEGRCPSPFHPAYWLRVGLCALLTMACGGAEYVVVPVLLRAAARAVL